MHNDKQSESVAKRDNKSVVSNVDGLSPSSSLLSLPCVPSVQCVTSNVSMRESVVIFLYFFLFLPSCFFPPHSTIRQLPFRDKQKSRRTRMASRLSSSQTTPAPRSRTPHTNNTTSSPAPSSDNDHSRHDYSDIYYYDFPLTQLIHYYAARYFFHGALPIFIWICYTWTSLEQRLQPHWVFVVDLVNTIIQRAHTCLVVIGAVATVIGTMMYFFCRPENDRRLDNFLSSLQILIKKPEYRATIIFILVGTYLLCPSCFVFPSNLLSSTKVAVLWALCFVGSAVVLYLIVGFIWIHVLVTVSIMHDNAMYDRAMRDRVTSQMNE
ncbi:MAG: hypothetical protein J3R72DRAFT_75345 [Linnemannia gamsii]|nr:MAG: hypothetical protein J3R72DRAFT_75345 [Linnemannia gamsii]